MNEPIKPFEEGWENIDGLERIVIWFNLNEHRLGKLIDDYKTFMNNFYVSCESPDLDDYTNFRSDIRDYDCIHKEKLIEGFFAMYNTSELLLELKSIKIINPEWN